MHRIRPLVRALLLACACAAAGTAAAQAPTRVFLVAGQSNAEGEETSAAEVDALPGRAGAADPQPDVLYWYETGDGSHTSGGWIPLQPEPDRQVFGPELTFARRVKGVLPGPIAIIKSTRGGSSLAEDWAPGATDGFGLHARTLALLQSALGDLTAQGVDWRFGGVLWQQGESDMLVDAHLAAYDANLAAFIARLRADLGEPSLPWFLGTTSDKSVWGVNRREAMRDLRAAQLAVAAADPDVHVVPTSHLAFLVNDAPAAPGIHFGTEGQLQLGEAYADAYLASLGVDVAHVSKPFAAGFPAAPGATVRVFVLAGQRSMEGEGAHAKQINAHPEWKALRAPQHDVAFRYRLGDTHVSTDWAPLGPADHLGNFGPELSFGRTLADGSADPVAIVKVTHSGAVLEDWMPTPDDASLPQYDAAVAFVRDALDDLVARGLEPRLEAVVWLPGEHDAWHDPFHPGYATELATLADALRADLGAPDLRWIVAELGDRLVWKKADLDAIDAACQAFADDDPRAWFVDTDALPYPAGSPTLGTKGALEFGRHLAEFVRGLGWTDLGGGTTGAHGPVTLAGAGPLVAGTTTTLALGNAPPAAPLVAWIAVAPTPFAALGGTVHAWPAVNQLAFVADGDGAFTAATPWPTGVPSGTSLTVQCAVADASVPGGITLSNGVRADVP